MARATAIVLSAAVAGAAAQTQITDSPHFLQAYQTVGSGVDCGGHLASSCSVCPGDNGAAWCNGSCLWLDNQCKPATWWNRFCKYTVDSIKKAYYMLPMTLILALVMTAYALVYKNKVVDKIKLDLESKDENGDNEQEVGLFDCFKSADTVLWVMFCAPVLMAKNYSKGGVQMLDKKMEYWPTCVLMFCGLHTFFFPFMIVFWVVRAIMAGKLNKNLGYKANFLKDLALTIFCFPCDVGRETLEVDKALNVAIKCAFKIEDTAPVETAVKKGRQDCTRMCVGAE